MIWQFWVVAWSQWSKWCGSFQRQYWQPPIVLEDDDSGEIRALAFGGENTPARVMTVNDARDRNSLAAFASLDLFLFFFRPCDS